jgi:predicted RND superfamily exporter protein
MKNSQFVVKYRWFIISGFLLITVFFGLQIPKAQIDPDLENYIPATMPSRINTAKIEKLFGSDELILVLFESDDILNASSLERIKKFSKKLKRLDGIDEVISPFDTKNISGENGMMVVKPAIEFIPQNESERNSLRESIKNNELAYKLVISDNFKYGCVIASIKSNANKDEILTQIDRLLQEIPGNEKVHKGGLPYIKKTIKKDIAGDMTFLMTGGIILMIISLFLSFRQFRGIILPLIIVVCSIVFGLGLLILFEWKISLITLLLPVILIAVANNYGIHLFARYQELVANTENPDKKQISAELLRIMANPILLAGVTTVAGILCMLTHIMVPARQLGIVTAIAIAYSLIMSLLFIPAVMSFLKIKKPHFVISQNKTIIDKVLDKISHFVPDNAKQIVIVSIIIALILTGGLFLVKVDANVENYFPAKHPVKVSANLINKYFGGSQNITLLFEGDIKSPELLKRMDYYESELKKTSGVGNVTSIAGVIKIMSKALNDKSDKNYNKIPDSRQTVAQYLELYSMNGEPEDFERLVDFNYEKAVMIVRINNASNNSINNIKNKIANLTKNDKNVKLIGGQSLIITDLSEAVLRGQVSSLLLSIVVVVALVIIFFKSFKSGLLSSIPLIFAVLFLFGIMGYLNIKLDIATALLTSIMVGAGVDYTTHFLYRYKEERQNGLNAKEAVQKTLATTGRGIIFNGSSVIVGFLVLLVSSFLPIKFFGFLVVTSIFICMIGALALVPSIVTLLDTKYYKPDVKISKENGSAEEAFFADEKSAIAK